MCVKYIGALGFLKKIRIPGKRQLASDCVYDLPFWKHDCLYMLGIATAKESLKCDTIAYTTLTRI